MKCLTMNFSKIYHIGLVAMAIVSFASCSMDDGDIVPVRELGTEKREYIVDAKSGYVDVDIYSNLSYTVDFIEEQDWATIEVIKDVDSRAVSEGDASVRVSFDDNYDFRRMVGLRIDGGSRCDTIYIKQEGINVPVINFSNSSSAVLGDEGRSTIRLESNLQMDDMSVDVIYSDEANVGWISNILYSNGFLIFDAKNNSDEVNLRNARIKVSYTDGWGEEIGSSLYIIQASALNEFGKNTSFVEVRDMVGRVNKDIYIEGHIISDKDSGNAGENPNTTMTAIDYSQVKKSAYVQSFDGKYGFRIKTATIDDNIFKRYSKVKILLKGSDIQFDVNPNSYTISGVTSNMVMSAEEGKASDLAVKHKFMSELTDDDIYTYVKLRDCEFPVRKGSLTPINEGYATLFEINRISKYPILIRDINGSSMYVLTNTTCGYRRDGSMLPYGSGSISGVVVNEKYERFSWDGGFDSGNIGRYQLRHMSMEDIEFAESIEDSFSALLVEYQYANIISGKIYPTNGDNGYIEHTSPDEDNISAGRGGDNTYLGPVGPSNKGNINGNGVILSNGQKLSTSGESNKDGKGNISYLDRSAWESTCTSWWDYKTNKGEAWMVNFSTKYLTTNKLSLQLSVMNNGAIGGKPRYFNVEWSTHGDHDSNDWNYISEYTCPDSVNWTLTQFWQTGGYKYIDIPLPLSMLNLDVVYIRLVCASSKSGETDSYDGGEVGSGGSAINYLAIRYNK